MERESSVAMLPQAQAPPALAPTTLLTANFPPVRGGTSRLFWELYRRAPVGRVRVVAGTGGDAAVAAAAPHLPVSRLEPRFPDWPLFSLSGVRGYRAAARGLGRELRAAPPRALHAARLLPEGWLARGAGLRFACWVHGEELNSIASSRQLRWMARRVLDDAALLMANSRHSARLLIERWNVDPQRVEVLRPGVDCAWFEPAQPSARARAELGWGDRPVVLTVARLQARKGHLRMLEALVSLRSKWPDLLWAVVGDGEQRGEIERRVEASGAGANVVLHGELDERRLLLAYQQCDLFVLPNIESGGDFEGFGMVLLEAQACARPVIAGASGGTREALDDGETGDLVDCSDPARLAAAIERMLTAPEQRRTIGERARRWALAFDWSRLAARAVEVWDARGV